MSNVAKGTFDRLNWMRTGRAALRLFLAAVLIAVSFASTSCDRFSENLARKTEEPQVQTPRPSAESVHLFFGNPSNASTDENDQDNFLIIGEGAVISYSNTRGTPNWVSWRTTKSDLGPSIRRPDFRPDPRLPVWYKRITPSDYSGSGYDRGHLLPSADRFGDARLNEETFMMTNIVPQTSALNQYPWEKLESYARGQARRGNDVYQIAGVYGNQSILNGKVIAPTNCWKIIAVLPRGSGAETLGERGRIIAVDMPNDDDIESQPWERYRTSVRAIEEHTGYDFFASLPREVQDRLETRVELSNRHN